MNMKDFEKRIASLEAEIKTLKEEKQNGFVQWYEKEENKATVISSQEFIVPVLKSILVHAKELKGKRVPKPLWDMARGVTEKGWSLTDKQEAYAFKLINTRNVAQVMDVLAS